MTIDSHRQPSTSRTRGRPGTRVAWRGAGTPTRGRCSGCPPASSGPRTLGDPLDTTNTASLRESRCSVRSRLFEDSFLFYIKHSDMYPLIHFVDSLNVTRDYVRVKFYKF